MTAHDPGGKTISLVDAEGALSQLSTDFHNEMLHRGLAEMTPRQWAEAFISWIDPYEFERRYWDTEEWLRKLGDE